MSNLLSLQQRTPHQNRNDIDRRPPTCLLGIVDLIRCCCSQENYDAWITWHGLPIGSAGIASYLARAAPVLAEESYAARFRQEPFDQWSAREHLADILMASAPLSPEEWQAAARTSLCEARTETTVRPCDW